MLKTPTRTPAAHTQSLRRQAQTPPTETLTASIQTLSKENEELRAYVDVLKEALDDKAYRIGLGDLKGVVLRDLEVLKHQCRAFEEDNARKAEEIQSLNSQITSLNSDLSIAHKQGKMSSDQEFQLNKKYFDMESQNQQIVEENKKLVTERDTLKEAMEQLESEHTVLRDTHTTVSDTLEQVKEAKKILEKVQEQTEQNLEKAREDINALSHSLAKRDSDLSALRTENEKFKKENKSMKDELSELGRTAEEALALQSDLVRAHSEMKENLETAEGEMSRMRKEHSERQQEYETIIEKQKQNQQNLEHRIEELQNDLKAAKEAMKDVEKNLKETEKKLTAKEIEMEKFTHTSQHSSQTLSSQVESLNAKIADLQETNNEYKTRTNNAISQMEKANNELFVIKAKLEGTEKDKAILERENSELHLTVKQLKEDQKLERTLQNGSMHNLKMEKKQVEDSLREAEYAQQSLQIEVNGLKAEIAKAERDFDSKLSSVTDERDRLQSMLESLNADQRSVMKEKQEATEEKLRTDTKLESALLKNTTLQQENAKLLSELTSLKQEHADLVSEHNSREQDTIQAKLTADACKTEAEQCRLDVERITGQLEEERRALIGQMQLLSADKDRAEEERAQRERELDEIRRRIGNEKDSVVAENLQLRRFSEEAKTQIADLKQTVSEMKKSSEQDRARLEAAGEQKMKDTNAQLKQLQSDILAKERQIGDLRQENASLAEKLASTSRDLQRIEQALHDEKIERDEERAVFERRIHETGNDESLAVTQRIEAEDQLNELRRELEATRQERDRLDSELQYKNEQAGNLQEDMAQVAKVKSELETMFEQMKEERHQRAIEMKVLRKEIEELTDESDRLRLQLGEEKKARTRNAAEWEMKEKEMSTKIAMYEKQLGNTKELHKTGSDQRTLAEQDARNVREQLAILDAEKAALENDLSVAVQELENYRESLTLSESAREAMKRDWDEKDRMLTQRLQECEEELRERGRRLIEAQEQLNTKDKVLEEMEALYDDIVLQNTRLQSENIRVKESVNIPLTASITRTPHTREPLRYSQMAKEEERNLSVFSTKATTTPTAIRTPATTLRNSGANHTGQTDLHSSFHIDRSQPIKSSSSPSHSNHQGLVTTPPLKAQTGPHTPTSIRQNQPVLNSRFDELDRLASLTDSFSG
ncbi:hypothetical protein BLNAU_17100 [Blattamonas nauphoetae]|uniref:Uncharacterized protein n=1 Tax=Blattamonas nauphoetae TaxID=2049346 RepID=A0ABQ9X7Q9_9EUKA|nr:hypothetical protein BLNAU_17100 [Blattamonas nauphoetae]